MRRRLSLVSALAILGAGALVPLRAELVVFDDGAVMKVAGYEVSGEQAILSFAGGGRMTLALDRIDRVVDDEVEPEPDPVPQALVVDAAPPLPLIPLRFEETQKVPDGPYGAMIFEAAKKHAINPQVVAALIRQESSGNSRARSYKGARGLMQLMPATAERFGVRREKLYDPKSNLEAGVRYLSWLVDQFPNDLSRVLAAYNAGEQSVWKYNGIPPYRETRDYVRRIYGTLGLTLAGI